MVLKRIRKKVKSAGRKIREAQAKVQGYTSPEEMMEHKKKLRQIERQERKRFKEWQIEEKFRQKRQQVQQGKTSLGVLGIFKTMAENAAKNIYGAEPKSKKRKRKKRKRKKRNKRR